jgi:hypothetical protein
VDQVRPLPRDLGAFVAAPRSGVHGLRRAVDAALAKGDNGVALTGMLRLLALGQLTTGQQRALRRMTGTGAGTLAPMPPPSRTTPSPSMPPGSGAYTSTLRLSFDQPAWSQLPPVLRDQLGACVLAASATRSTQ